MISLYECLDDPDVELYPFAKGRVVEVHIRKDPLKLIQFQFVIDNKIKRPFLHCKNNKHPLGEYRWSNQADLID